MEKLDTIDGQDSQQEKGLHAVGIEFISENGFVSWANKYEDGSKGLFTSTPVETNDQDGIARLKKQLESDFVESQKR